MHARRPCSAAFKPHGEVKKVHLAPKQECGFVELATHEQAVAALRALRGGRLAVGGKVLRVNWAHKAGGDAAAGLSGPTSHLYGAAADPAAAGPTAAAAAAGAGAPPAAAGAAPPAAAAAPPLPSFPSSVAPWAFMAAGLLSAPPPPGAPMAMPPWPMMMPPWPGGALPPAGSPAWGGGMGHGGPVRDAAGDARAQRQREAAPYPSMDSRQAGGKA